MLSRFLKNICRNIDVVMVKGSKQPLVSVTRLAVVGWPLPVSASWRLIIGRNRIGDSDARYMRLPSEAAKDLGV